MGLATFTPPQVQPGTPAYQAPEASLFSLQFMRQPAARYVARPADDLYALGVTACRLVTGQYPELAEPARDEQGTWHLRGAVLPAALREGAPVEPALRACILRMLAEKPQERSRVEELAEALERAAGQTVPEPSHEHVSPPTQGWTWRQGLSVAASVALLAAGAWWLAPGSSREKPSAAVHAEAVGASPAEAETAGLGEAAAPTSSSAAPALQSPEALAEEPLPKPRPGQLRPDAQGRCPRKRQIALNGGCWRTTLLDGEGCSEVGGSMFKGLCYLPSLPAPRRGPTSSPTHEP